VAALPAEEWGEGVGGWRGRGRGGARSKAGGRRGGALRRDAFGRRGGGGGAWGGTCVDALACGWGMLAWGAVPRAGVERWVGQAWQGARQGGAGRAVGRPWHAWQGAAGPFAAATGAAPVGVGSTAYRRPKVRRARPARRQTAPACVIRRRRARRACRWSCPDRRAGPGSGRPEDRNPGSGPAIRSLRPCASRYW